MRVRNVEAGPSGRLRPVQENWPISGRPVTAGSGSNGLTSSFYLFPTTAEEIENEISSLKIGKADNGGL